jgi:predicted MPP superfamily phosphohydrolase
MQSLNNLVPERVKAGARNKAVFAVVAIALLIAIAYFIAQPNDNSVTVTRSNIKTSKIPRSFNNFKILQISDFHGKDFGSKQQYLVKLVRNCKPDIIAITGDLIDRDNYDDKASMELVDAAVKIAPVYYVTGNHEWQSGKYLSSLKPKLESAGVVVLSDANFKIKRGDEEISIAGIDDVTRTDWDETKELSVVSDVTKALKGISAKDFKILLAHRPEMIKVYAESNTDLVLSGHTHGGQVQVPFIGAIFAPDQGFFPKYASGEYKIKDSVLIISKGIGNSTIPLRMLCEPEFVLVTLKK